MYGCEIAVFIVVPADELVIELGLLDESSHLSNAVAHTAHIHTWPTVEMFSKARFLGRGYDEYLTNGYRFNFKKINDYCLGIALGLIS